MTSVLLITLLLTVLSAVWAVVTVELMHAAIGLALCSASLALAMYVLHAPLAAVFELSVCAGLITVIFASTISMVRPLSGGQEKARAKDRLRRFVWLPVAVLACAIGLFQFTSPLRLPLLTSAAGTLDVAHVLWDTRRFHLVGQLLLILVGVFAVVTLFKPAPRER